MNFKTSAHHPVAFVGIRPVHWIEVVLSVTVRDYGSIIRDHSCFSRADFFYRQADLKCT